MTDHSAPLQSSTDIWKKKGVNEWFRAGLTVRLFRYGVRNSLHCYRVVFPDGMDGPGHDTPEAAMAAGDAWIAANPEPSHD